MRIVRKLILLLLLIVAGCATTKNYQNIFHGTFHEKYSFNMGFYYKFKNGTFKTITMDDLGSGKKIAGGMFTISGDTLTLNYIPTKIAKLPSYRFISKEPVPTNGDDTGDSIGSATFKIVNCQGKPLVSTLLVVRNDSQERINSYWSDSLGIISNVPIKGSTHSFWIRYLGLKAVTISADILTGYHFRVKVILSKNRYSDYSGTNKYVIKKAEKDKIILRNLENNHRVVLIRSDNGQILQIFKDVREGCEAKRVLY